MSWIEQLAKTYDNLSKNESALEESSAPLIPIGHTIQTAHVEIVINENAETVEIRAVSKENAATIVPCTEDSAARSSGTAPHMLYDNLKYICAETAEICKNDKLKGNYEAYCNQLVRWCQDDACPEDVKLIYKYIKTHNIAEEIIKYGLFEKDEKGMYKKWNGDSKNKPTDFASTFVRFRILHGYELSPECNENTELIQNFTEYDKKVQRPQGMCYVSGKQTSLTYKHPSKIRSAADSAKLISSNDTSGYTYRGRFLSAEEAMGVGYEISQKAHSALRWIISNQGFRTGQQTVAIWSVELNKTANPFKDTTDMFDDFDDFDMFDEYSPMDIYARNVEKAINGYKHGDLHTPLITNKIVIMILESALDAQKGRLSISYYREMFESDYLENIEHWHKSCVWNHNYKMIKKETDQEDGSEKDTVKRIKYTGAPSIKDMVFAAYGDNISDKVKKRAVEVLLSCITDRLLMPKDIMMSAVKRISNPTAIISEAKQKTTNVGYVETMHNKSLSVTCAMIRKYYYDHKKGEYDMALDKENRDRSYLFGRLLAYAEEIESYAIYLNSSGNERRVPNARKLRQKFSIKPLTTFSHILDKLAPYENKLYEGGDMLYKEMMETVALMNEADFKDNKALDPTYILGYACQQSELRERKIKAKQAKQEKTEVN